MINWERSDSNLDQVWNLSLVGDWNSFTENSSMQNRTHGPTHELLSAGGSSLTHDTKGNMTLIPAVLRPDSNDLALKWDFENKMTTADVGNDSTVDVTYKWDALGRRVYRDDGSSAVIYVQVGQRTIADYGYSMSPTSPMYNYVYASYIDEPVLRDEPSASNLLYFHRNHQYSIIALTDGSGAIAERYAYSAYGEPMYLSGAGSVIGGSAEDSRYTYTGREWDADLAMHHFRARFLGARIGRFQQRDPAGFFDGANTYARYAPLTSQDPQGLQISIPSSPITNYDDCIETRDAIIGQWPYMCKDLALDINCRRSRDKPKDKQIGAGNTDCSDGTITIDIYYDDNTPQPPNSPFVWLPPRPNIEQIMFHELQHARDICDSKCDNKCDVMKLNSFEPIRAHCDQVLCMEVRALIVEGGCARVSSPSGRRTCIQQMLATYYGGLCPAESYTNAMNECYFDYPGGVPTIPPPFPY